MEKSKWQKWRLAIQIIFVLFILYLSVGHYLEEEMIMSLPGIASLHAVCPFGGVVTLYTFFTTGDYVKKIHQSSFIMMLSLLGILILGGASFCGWICPLGSIQEWLGKLGRKFFKRRYNSIPKKVDNILKYGKYLVLFLVIYNTTRSLNLVFENYDPYYNLFNIWTDEISITGYIVVAITLIASLFIERPFCRYACPLGALNGLFNKISVINFKRSKKSCINCGECDQVCPVGIDVSKTNYIKNTECIRCLKCVEACPVNVKDNNTLTIKPIWIKPDIKKGLVKKGVYVLLMLAVFLGAIGVSSSTGLFITERVKTFEDVSDIRGSSTINEVIENYPFNLNILQQGFGLREEISLDTKLKNVNYYMGIDEDIEYMSPETLRDLTIYLDQNLSEFALYLEKDLSTLSNYTSSTDIDNITLREYILNSRKGTITYLINGFWITEIVTEKITELELPAEETEETNITGRTTLNQIKGMISDFEVFKKEFAIPDEVALNTNLKTLSDEFGIEVSKMRDYIETILAEN